MKIIFMSVIAVKILSKPMEKGYKCDPSQMK